MFYAFAFPPGVYVGTLNLIASVSGLSILTCHTHSLGVIVLKKNVIISGKIT